MDTKWSCQGDENNNYYIMFQDYIEDSKIECFMRNFYNEYDNTDIIGKFVKWSRFVHGQLVDNWMYIVANPRLAYIDLKKMKRL